MCATRSFFQTTLRQDQLAQGIQLQRPFRNILPTIRAFTHFTHPTTPDELKPRTLGNPQNHDNRRRSNADQEPPSKRQRINQAGPLRSNIPSAIYRLKQQVSQRFPNVTLTCILHEAGSDIPTLPRNTGLPENTCCRLAIWGACPNLQCSLFHEPINFSSETIKKAISILQPGIQRLLAQPAQPAQPAQQN